MRKSIGFVFDPAFDANEYFRYAFGTHVEKGNPPCLVQLKVAAAQVPYLRSLPLHHSQRETLTTQDYSIFQVNVALTIELYLQILYFGAFVEVLEPQDLRDIIGTEVYHMAQIYGIIPPSSPEETERIMEELCKDPEFMNKPIPKDLYSGMASKI